MNFFKSILPEKQFLKVLSINSLGTLVRLISGFILSKIIAIYIGPQGIGLVGNLRSFFNTIQSIGSVGFHKGIIKLTAENKNDRAKLSKILSTSFFIGGFVVFFISIILFSFASFWSELILNSTSYTSVIRIFAFALPFHIANYFVLAVINGFEKYRIYILINIISNILSLLLTIFFILKFNINGLLHAVILMPAFGIIISCIIISKHGNFLSLFKIKNIELNTFKTLFEYSLMAIITSILVPPTLIAIRNHIVDVNNLTSAGYWESMNRISNYYLIFTSSLLSLYLYPKLSIAKDSISFKKNIITIFKTLIPLMTTGLISLYFLRVFIIKLLLAENFIPMESLFFWQLLGDFFKISSSILAYQFFAKKMTKDYIITEIISVAILYSSSIFFIDSYGYEGASIGYFICHCFYFFLLLFWFRKQLLI